jgi:cytochrome c
MNSFEFNKIAGAVLGTGLLALGLNSLSEVIYDSERPEKPGYAIEVAEAGTGSEATGGAEAPGLSLGTLLASADPKKGEAAAKACAACHDFSKGGPNKVGPNLYGIVMRKHAAHEGFAYSEALAAKSGEDWTYQALDEFIKAPKAAIPGTKMADLLAYLASLSDAPPPFPAP